MVVLSDAEQRSDFGRDWVPGQVLLDKYRVLERIGAGGMGVVHSARRLSLGDVVAIKSVLPERSTPANRHRFLREARALARIRHPNIVRVFDFGEADDGRPFMVMEYLDGPTLADVIARGRPALPLALDLFLEICRAIEAGHRRGVVHRDIKPGNVMFDRSDDGGETIKVLDFGLARIADEVEQSQAGMLVGTCGYMSPEQIEQGGGGPASDVFALGVVLYELVTGERPFEAPTQIATIMRICEGEYPPPREKVPDLPQAVVDAITAALERSPDARPASPLELAERALGRTPSTAVSIATFSSAVAPITQTRAPDDHTVVPATRDDATQAMDRPRETAESPEDESARVHAAVASPPFVGRRLEIETLLDLLTIPTEEAGFALISGAAGIGRTRLLAQFAQLARAQGAVVFEGRFWGYEGARVEPGETYLRMLGPAGVGLLDSGDPADQLAIGFDRREGSAKVAAAFESAASRGRQPTMVLLLDDLHLALRSDLSFLTYLLRGRERSCRVVVVGTARSDAARSDAKTELSRWLLDLATLKGRRILTLGRFDDDELRSWLDGVFRRLQIHPRDLRRLARASGGVPYVLSELVRHLIASQRLVPVPTDEGGVRGGWVCNPLDGDVLPESVSAAVADQLSALSEPLRNMLETAAVLGEQFRFDVLERAVGPGVELDQLVDDAVGLDLLSEQDPELHGQTDLRFRSSTVQRVLYDRLGARRRKRLHQTVVEALIATHAPERIAKLLAWHYRAIGDFPNALTWGLWAAGDSLGHHDSDAAELALEHAHAAAEALTRAGQPPSLLGRLRLESLAGTLDIRVGRYGEGGIRLAQARMLIEALLDTGEPLDLAAQNQIVELGFTIALELARCRVGIGELESAVALGYEALELSRDIADPETALGADWNARVQLAHALGRFGRWQDATDSVRPIVETTPTPALRVLHVLALREQAWIDARRGSLTTAVRFSGMAMDEARACGDPLAEYHAVSVSAVVASASGDHRQAIALYREALRMARSLSLRRREMIEMANLALTLLDAGSLDEALRHMLGAIGLTRELGDKASASDARVGLGRILRARGELEAASDSFRRGFEACSEVGRHEYAAIALLELGRCELDRREWSAALAVLLLARDRFTELGSLLQWEAELALASAARGLGEQGAVLSHAQTARELLQSMRGELGATGKLERGLAAIQAVLTEP